MAQTKIIVDTNSYLRLAQNIHPLLGVPFGKKENTLYMHAELNAEFRASSRLKSKFQWACEVDYVDNRRRSLSISKRHKAEIEETFDYMWSYVKEEFHRKRQRGPSRTDTIIIATAATLQIPVLTDDQDMVELAEMYGVHNITSLEMLKLMLDEKHINQSMIQRVVEQWQYDNDTPYSHWRDEYRKLFDEEPPKG